MKNFGAVVFLALASSFVTGIPTYSPQNRARALLGESVDITTRALQLVPGRIHVGSRSVNETENAARSMALRSANTTEAENQARSLIIPRSENGTDVAGAENVAQSLVMPRSLNETGAQSVGRSIPRIRRTNRLRAAATANGTESA
ncbi:hypothetical protein AAE478_010208 [Parahypoxylon ruwenzoriense]